MDGVSRHLSISIMIPFMRTIEIGDIQPGTIIFLVVSSIHNKDSPHCQASDRSGFNECYLSEPGQKKWTRTEELLADEVIDQLMESRIHASYT